MEFPNHHSLRWLLFFVGLLASWLSFSGILPLYLFALIWFGVFIFLATQKSHLRYFVILFSSWVFLPIATFVKTTKHYFRGDAVFYRDSLATPESLNLDQKYRIWNEKKGSAIWGDEAFVRASNNFTVRFWVTLAGYQDGSYSGTFPDVHHAYQIVKTQGKIFPFEKTATAIRIRFDNGTYEISDVKHLGNEDLSKCTRAQVTIVNDELVLVYPVCNVSPSILYLADYQKSSIVARYYDAEKAMAPVEDERLIRRKRGKN